MKADAYNLATVFGNDRQLFAPLFQRPYVWTREQQWEPLWEDVSRLADKTLRQEHTSPYFMGAVVLEQFPVPVGKPDARSIIDGQQRLTTLQLFLAALRDHCAEALPEATLHAPIDKLLSNDKDLYKDEQNRFKLWPTNIDRAAYELALSSGGPSPMRAAATAQQVSSNILGAYSYFHDRIREWSAAAEAPEQALRALFAVIRQSVRIVVIDMDSEDDAQVIFETLNARGTPLLPSDLVKNYLFSRAALEGLDTERLYETCWKEFDEDSDFWRGEMVVGRLRRARLDVFLQHYLTLMADGEVSATKLFAQYKAFADGVDGDARTLLSSFKRHAVFFKRFFTLERDTAEGEFFHKLRVMETSTVYPFLLGLYNDIGDDPGRRAEKMAVLQVVESFLVRRMVCQLTTKNYNRLFLDLIQHLRTRGSIDREKVEEFLRSREKDATRWPDDMEFYRAWMTVPLYNRLKRNRLRLLLREMDAGLQTRFTESYYLKEGLTVEHIMPQHWEEHWPLCTNGEELAPEEELQKKERRRTAVHTIGNLTFLTQSLNPAVSNGPFDLKKRKILEHSAINLNRPLQERETWDEGDIDERGASLFDIARARWPHPDAASFETTPKQTRWWSA